MAKGAVVEIEVVETLETIKKSDTQELRVFIVKNRGKEKVAIQKFYRTSKEEEWKNGKGFHLDFEEGQMVLEALEKGLEKIE